jgi:hypothetical protein
LEQGQGLQISACQTCSNHDSCDVPFSPSFQNPAIEKSFASLAPTLSPGVSETDLGAFISL